MSFVQINLALVLLIVLIATFDIVYSNRDFSGAIEIVGYNNRRARMNHVASLDDTVYVAPQLKKDKADIEIVKQNIESYNKLMKVDTKKLTDQQKDMLERIVERVARLQAALGTDSTNKSSNASNSTDPIPAQDAVITTVTPSKVILSSPSLSTSAPTPFSISTTLEPTFKPHQTEARANNNNLNPSIDDSRIGSKSKGRQSTTAKPSFLTKGATKRIPALRVSSLQPEAVPSSGPHALIASTNTGLRIPAGTTIEPQQQLKQFSKLPNQVVAVEILPKQQIRPPIDDIPKDKTLAGIIGGDNLSPSSISIGSDLIYDSNGTASSMIDRLAYQGREDYYTSGSSRTESTKEKKPSATAKPTKYHYYPHNQHIYLLPECAIQQVCNAVYVRLNYTQPLCACPSRYRDPCSASLNEDDQHTTKLIGNSKKKAITLAKTCEATTEMRECRTPKDWSLLALQNTRTGKSHYLVICRCPDHFKLEGPMAHDQPTYASVPGIRVFGMMCVKPGFSIRKSPVQPPKRYQLQKPLYMSTSNKYTSNKDSRPSHQEDSYQTQHQANYLYLNRPDSSPIISTHNTHDLEDNVSLNSFGGIYGRNNERKGETDSASATEEMSSSTGETTASTEIKREKRSVIEDNIPQFPWNQLEEFQQSAVWE